MRPIRSYTTQTAIYLSLILLITVTAVIIFFHWQMQKNHLPNLFHNITGGNSPFGILYLIFIKTAFAFTAGLILKNLFQKIASPEIFFFSLAILSLSLTSIRSLLLIEGLLNYPVYLSETITRAVYFGKIITVLCLFTSGLFSTGISFQKQESFLLLIILISFVLSVAIPIDLFKRDIILLRGNVSEYGINLVFILIQLFAILNFIVGSIKNNNYDYLFLAFSVGLISVGNELLFVLIPGWISAGAILLLISGTVLFGYKIHKIYQWT
ncbi:MAG: hypothetical protein KAH95_08710 [Spirochaetales bacterium]|nr:hypothetical protein [Spirochaetales bacterium]